MAGLNREATLIGGLNPSIEAEIQNLARFARLTAGYSNKYAPENGGIDPTRGPERNKILAAMDAIRKGCSCSK